MDILAGAADRSRNEANAVYDIIVLDFGNSAVFALDSDGLVADIGDRGVEVSGNFMILESVTQIGGVCKACRLGSYKIRGVLDYNRMMSLKYQIQSGLAGGLSAAEEYDSVAYGNLVLEDLCEGKTFIEAGDLRHRSDNRTCCDNDLIKASECAEVSDFGIESDIYALLLDLASVPLNKLSVLLFECFGRSCEEESAELVGLLEYNAGMAALLEYQSTLHTADSSADDRDLLGLLCRDYLVLVVLHRCRVQSAAREVQGVPKALDIGRAFVFCEVEAAIVAADAGLYLVLAAFKDLVYPFMVDEVLSRYSYRVESSCSDLLSCLDGY